MASPLRNVRFHATESDQEELLALGSRPRGFRGGASRGAIEETFDNDEAAARFYLMCSGSTDGRILSQLG